MKFEVPAECYGNEKLVREIVKQLLKPEQFKQLYRINPVIHIDLSVAFNLSQWLEYECSELSELDIKTTVTKIFMDLREKGIVDKCGSKNTIDPAYGYTKNNSVLFTLEGYQLIKHQYKLDSNVNSYKFIKPQCPLNDYDYLPNLILYHQLGSIGLSQTIYKLLGEQGYLIRKGKGRKFTTKLTRKSNKYIKIIPRSDIQRDVCVFNIEHFKTLMDNIGLNKPTTPTSTKLDYTITDLVKMCGHNVDPKKAHCDKIVKGINLSLKIDMLIEKPDGKRWRLTEWGLEKGLGFNETKGKTVQARFYKTDYIIKLINTIIEEEKQCD